MDYMKTSRLVMPLVIPILLLALGIPAVAGEIHEAIKAGDLSKVKSILVEDPAQISARDEALSTPLHIAVADSQVAIARMLIEKGADVDAGDTDNSRPLHWVAIQGKRELAEVLLAAGADLEAEEDYGNTPLVYAVYAGDGDMARLLLDRGADPHHTNTQDQTPLQYAVAGGGLELVRLLVTNGADVNHQDAYGLTPLFAARVKEVEQDSRLLLTTRCTSTAGRSGSFQLRAPTQIATYLSGLWNLAWSVPAASYFPRPSRESRQESSNHTSRSLIP
jgi:ankyrin repeat protein